MVAEFVFETRYTKCMSRFVAGLAKLLPLVLVLVIVSLVSAGVLAVWGGPERMRAWVVGAGWWAPVVFVVLKMATNVFAPLSGSPLVLAAGALFGVWEGLALVTIGDVLGECTNFWIARVVGRPGIRRLLGRTALKRVDEAVENVGGWRALVFAAVFLSAVYDFVSYAAGLSKLPFWQFFWITLVGGVPSAFLFVVLGRSLTAGASSALLAGGLVVGGGVWLLWRKRLRSVFS